MRKLDRINGRERQHRLNGFIDDPPLRVYHEAEDHILAWLAVVFFIAVGVVLAIGASGCGSVQGTFLEAERATYASLAPYVKASTEAEVSTLHGLLLSELDPTRRDALERRVDLLRDHQRTLVLWDWALKQHEEGR